MVALISLTAALTLQSSATMAQDDYSASPEPVYNEGTYEEPAILGIQTSTTPAEEEPTLNEQTVESIEATKPALSDVTAETTENETADDADKAENDVVNPFASTDLSIIDVDNNPALQDALLDAQIDPTERQKKLEQQARELAFDAAINGLLPMKPAEIRELLKRYDSSTEAAQTPYRDAPKPEITVQTVSLDPGVAPPVIKVAPGHVTTLSMLDISGAPWSIQDVSWGGDFDILQPEDGGHIIRISPLGAFKRGNMSIRLIDLSTPITFVLETHQDVVQYRFDARIPEYGPKASIPIIDNGGIQIAAGSGSLNAVLDGVPPNGSVKMVVDGVDGRTSAYLIGDKVYLRTPHVLLSPAWDSSVNSVDGLKVYTIPDTPVLLLSNNGKIVRASLSEAPEDSEGL